MEPADEILQAFEGEKFRSVDSALAELFGVELIAAMSARRVVERAVVSGARGDRLLEAIDEELSAVPGLEGPVPAMARYLGSILAAR
jgi:hypothetical protein